MKEMFYVVALISSCLAMFVTAARSIWWAVLPFLLFSWLVDRPKGRPKSSNKPMIDGGVQ